MISPLASVILSLLKLAGVLLAFARERQMLRAGADAEIAKASASVLLMTQSAKETMARVTAMDEGEVDELMRRLEP
jgi:hypothetical protein